MFLQLLLATVPIAVVLTASEYLWRKQYIAGERGRKFIHILSGVWMAFWPFYIPFDGIFMLGCAALTLLLYSRFTNLFHAIYAVKRKTYGELFFALAIIMCAYFGREAWIFTTSILLLALADGGAAVIGRFWGITNQYLVFGSKNLLKSRAGTLAYCILAYLSVGVGLLLGGSHVLLGNYPVFLGLPALMTVVENMSPYGLDNIVTPLIATLVLNTLV